MPQQLPNEHYQALSNYLANRQWREADQSTALLMQQPSTDLLILDELWTRFSTGHFGFSIQSQIWQEMGCPIATSPYDNYASLWETGDSDVEREKVNKFAQRIGWINSNSEWIPYENLNFSLNAPHGHLPTGHGRGLDSLIRRFFYVIAAKKLQ